jgi:SOS-response transcriptional repressor LexA
MRNYWAVITPTSLLKRKIRMTLQQKIYYDAIKSYIYKNGCSPAYQEIARMVGVRSLASVAHMVDRLVRDGYLVKTAHSSARSLAVVPGKLHGFNICERNHPVIYFMEGVCPLCTEIQKHTPPREVRSSEVF